MHYEITIVIESSRERELEKETKLGITTKLAKSGLVLKTNKGLSNLCDKAFGKSPVNKSSQKIKSLDIVAVVGLHFLKCKVFTIYVNANCKDFTVCVNPNCKDFTVCVSIFSFKILVPHSVSYKRIL